MKNVKELEKDFKDEAYNPSKEKQIVERYISKRIKEMKDYRKNLGIDDEFEDADAEYLPDELDADKGKKRLESDDELGLRARLVPVGDSSDAWRSRNSDPMLLTKIQTALSIIIDRNPEAVLTALVKKYEKTTDLANALWKRNWQISNAKQVYRLFAFNLFKYGWAAGRSYPRIVKYDKQVLTELDEENPDNNKYEDKELVLFNDVAKQNLNPKKTWIDELARPYDPLSRNENYFEIDYSYDSAKLELEQYPDFKFIRPGDRMQYGEEKQEDDNQERSDIVTIGFFESRLKDLKAIYVPSRKIVISHSCLPNDDGMLSIWDAPLMIRDAECPYGISLWRIIKQKKALYDKMQNMSMDQLVLSIMKMFFHDGVGDITNGDGNIKITPGKGVKMINGKVTFLEVPGPGKEAIEWKRDLKASIDDDSGITPTLNGEITGKTLGETTIARESALKRMKTPLENISWAIEQDAYLTLSWTSQILSVPEMKEFANISELKQYESENGIEVAQNQGVPEIYANTDEEGNTQSIQGAFYPQLSLHLEDREGKLVESKDSRYFQVGKEIQHKDLKWQGIFSVLPKSILSPSLELEKQRKIEVFNILAPLLIQPPQVYAKAVKQLLKVNEEDPENWLPDTWMQFLNQTQAPLFIQSPMMNPNPLSDPMGQSMGQQEQSMQAGANTTPNEGSQTVVPQSTLPTGNIPGVNADMSNNFGNLV